VERELESEADVPALVQGTTQSKARELLRWQPPQRGKCEV